MMKRLGLLLLLAASFGCHGPQEREGRRGQAAASPDELMKRLDKNGDLRLSASEFDGPEEHFLQFDKNADGFLTADEIPSGPPEGGERRR